MELLEGAAEGEARGLENVDLVNDEGIHGSDGPSEGAAADLEGESLALVGGEEFAVAQAGDGASGIEDDGGGIDRAEECAASGLVGAGDEAEAAGAQGALQGGRATESGAGGQLTRALSSVRTCP